MRALARAADRPAPAPEGGRQAKTIIEPWVTLRVAAA